VKRRLRKRGDFFFEKSQKYIRILSSGVVLSEGRSDGNVGNIRAEEGHWDKTSDTLYGLLYWTVISRE